MQRVLRDLLRNICLCDLDDIVIFARTPQELLEHLRTVLDRVIVHLLFQYLLEYSHPIHQRPLQQSH